MMAKVLSQVYPQAKPYERKIEPAAIVCIDGVNTTQSSDQIASGRLIPDELNQTTGTINGQTDPDNGDFVVERAQAGRFNIKISVK